jgi:hypothetical protein
MLDLASTFDGSVSLSFVIPSEPEGSAVSRTFRGSVLSIDRAQSDSAQSPKEQSDEGSVFRSPQQVAQLMSHHVATYFDALSARPLRNISLTVASK